MTSEKVINLETEGIAKLEKAHFQISFPHQSGPMCFYKASIFKYDELYLNISSSWDGKFSKNPLLYYSGLQEQGTGRGPTLGKMDSNTIFNLEDFQPFQKVGNDKRILDSGKKLNLGEGILHKCKFHGKLCACYFSYAYFDDVLINM